MADERENLSDEEFFNSVVSGESDKEEPKEREEGESEGGEEEQSERARDEHGRFKPKGKAEDAPAPEVKQPVAEEPAKPVQEQRQESEGIPSWRLKEESERRREAEEQARTLREQMLQMQRQIAELRPKQEPEAVDPFEDPNKFAQTLEQRLTRQFQERYLTASFDAAHEQHGEEFEKAYSTLITLTQSGDRAVRDRIVNSPNPGKALISWHRERETVREIGGDLTGYRQRLRDELLKDPEFRKQAMDAWREEATTQERPSNVITPPSLARTPAAQRNGPGDDDMSDRDFLRSNLRLR